jgi:hypothetical protein
LNEPIMSAPDAGDTPSFHRGVLFTMGRYQVQSKLGQGGQATTYLAWDPDLGHKVVLKLYDRLTPAGREAALNEGRALRRVKSPYVARCLDVVEGSGGRLALVIEQIVGRDLSQVPADELRDPERLALLVEQVAEGLAEVHACGLLHRDVKPQNIILGHDGLPRLVDFGLAASFASDTLHRQSGTPAFMAPEQADGRGEAVDPRTDVFGLGAVLYTLLAERPPYQGASRDATLELARQGRFDPPRKHNPRASRSMERICLKAMARSPQDRYGSASELAGALRRHRGRRLRAFVLTGCLGTLVAAAGLIWASRPEPGSPPARPSPSASVPSVLPLIREFSILHEPKNSTASEATIGRGSYGAVSDDHVAIRATLTEPAYAYLIAFQPDGQVVVCDPLDESEPPKPSTVPGYPHPPASPASERFELTDGVGVQAFALVASRSPLPAFHDWIEQHGRPPWRAGVPVDPGIVWRHDGTWIDGVSADNTQGTRGPGAKTRRSHGAEKAVDDLGRWLAAVPGVEGVAVEAFTVEPEPGR